MTQHFVCNNIGRGFLLRLLQEFGPSYDCSALDNPLSAAGDTATFDCCSAQKTSCRYV